MILQMQMLKFNSGTENVQWEAVTDRFTEAYMGEKATSKVKLEVELETGSTIEIYLSVDNGAYSKIDTYTGASYRYFKTYQIPRQAFCFQIKLVGTGKATVHSLVRDIIILGD
jgi:hypothetical protein